MTEHDAVAGLSIAKVLALVLTANGAPVLARRFAPGFWAKPVDGGAIWRGRRLLGSHKTWRGLAASMVGCAVAAPLLGLPVAAGLAAGAAAMLGDLLSSFIKRRRGLESGGMAFGIDQIPESLLPALIVQRWLPLGLVEIVLIPLIFLLLELPLSRLLFRLGIRQRPH